MLAAKDDSPTLTLRPAIQQDLAAINMIIEAAVMSWQLPERVRRLALPSCLYTEMDLQHLEIVEAVDENDSIGVAAWEQANPADLPEGRRGLLLHGIFVAPKHWRHGVGRALFHAAEQAVHTHAGDGLLVRAQQDANGFFEKMGMQRMTVRDAQRDYANRYWKAVTP